MNENINENFILDNEETSILENDFNQENKDLENNNSNIAPFLHNIPVNLSLEAGNTQISLQELAKIQNQSIIPLNTSVNEPLNIKVNDCIIGKGEIITQGDNYALRVIKITNNLGLINN